MSTPSPENIQHLARLAQRLSVNRVYMAYLLANYQVQEKLDETGLANKLSMEVAQLPRLALCKRPVTESKDFTNQIRQLASYTGADETVLVQIIRQVESLEQFFALPGVEKAEAEKRPLASSSGLLAAARDKEELDDRPTSEDKPNDNEKATS